MRQTALSAMVCSTWLITSCAAPKIESKALLGNGDIKVETTHYHDFIGISNHGELFDFQECSVDPLGLSDLLKSTSFLQSPDYSAYKQFYKNKLSGVESSPWTKTPINLADAKQAQQLFMFGNLQDDAHSRLAIRKNYLSKPGNYFAYYAAYPVGRILYILAPAEGKLYIFRKCG